MNKKILNKVISIHNFISSSGSGTVINYGSGSTSQKVTVPTVPVPVPQHWLAGHAALKQSEDLRFGKRKDKR
jgi:hypothetical protein